MATAMVEDPNLEDDQLSSMTADDIVRASRLLDNEIRVLKVTDLHIFFKHQHSILKGFIRLLVLH